MPERRVLAFPAPATLPFPEGSVVLLDHPSENTFAVAVQEVVEKCLERVVPTALPPVPTDYLPVLRNSNLLILPASFFSSLIPVVTTIANGLMIAADKLKLDSVNLNLLVKTGGAIGQVPVKISATDGDWVWATPSGDGSGGSGGLSSLASQGAGVSLIVSQASGVATLHAVGATSPVVVSIAGDGTLTIGVNLATTTASGLLSSADKTKLDSVAANANPNPPTFVGTAVGLVPAPSSLPASAAKFLQETGGWAIPSGSGGGIAEAPTDGGLYGRKDSGWTSITADGAGDLDSLTDVTTGGAVNGQILRYNAGNWGPSSETVLPLQGLSNVQISSPTNNDVLKYNSSLSKWVNGSSSSGGGGPIPTGTTLTGPVTHAFVAGDVDKITRVNLAAGDVTVTIDNTVASNTGEVLASAFVTEGATGVYKLIFQNAVAAQMPIILNSQAVSRTSGIENGALAANANDTRAFNVPAGTDRALTFIIFAARAALQAGTDVQLTVTPAGGATINIGTTTPWTVNSQSSGAQTDAAYDIYSHTIVMGTDTVDPKSVSTTVVMNNFNVQCYVLFVISSGFTDQTTPTENQTPGRDLDPGTAQFTQTVAGTTSGSIRRMIYAAAQPTQKQPSLIAATVAGALQLNTGLIGSTIQNRAGGSFISAHEDAPSAAAYDCVITYSSAVVPYDRARIALALRPSSVATMTIRTTGDVLPQTAINNKQVTLLYTDDGIANLLM